MRPRIAKNIYAIARGMSLYELQLAWIFSCLLLAIAEGNIVQATRFIAATKTGICGPAPKKWTHRKASDRPEAEIARALGLRSVLSWEPVGVLLRSGSCRLGL